MKTKILIGFILFTAVFYASPLLFADNNSTYSTTSPEQKELIIEKEIPEFSGEAKTTNYEYSVSAYNPPVKRELYSNALEASYDSPENAAISYISSMAKVDFQWFLNSHTAKEQGEILKLTEKYDPNYEKWNKGFQYIFENKSLPFHAILFRKVKCNISHETYVLVHLKLFDSNQEEIKEMENEKWVKLDKDGKWKILRIGSSKDAHLFTYWDFQGKIRKIKDFANGTMIDIIDEKVVYDDTN